MRGRGWGAENERLSRETDMERRQPVLRGPEGQGRGLGPLDGVGVRQRERSRCGWPMSLCVADGCLLTVPRQSPCPRHSRRLQGPRYGAETAVPFWAHPAVGKTFASVESTWQSAITANSCSRNLRKAQGREQTQPSTPGAVISQRRLFTGERRPHGRKKGEGRARWCQPTPQDTKAPKTHAFPQPVLTMTLPHGGDSQG